MNPSTRNSSLYNAFCNRSVEYESLIMAAETTNIAINLNINHVPKGYYTQNLIENSRHVVLNLDPVIINPRKSRDYPCKSHQIKDDLSQLEKCQQLFISKSAEPWCQVYVVKTRIHRKVHVWKSDGTACCGGKTVPHTIRCHNSKEDELMRITGDEVDNYGDGRELSFTVYIPSSAGNKLNITGQIKLFDLNGFHFVTGINNVKEDVQFSTRAKSDSIQIIQDGQCVAIIDFLRQSVINWIDSYMLTFTKDLSCNSKAIIIAACICYDIGFCQRSDTIKTIFIYFMSILSLFSAAVLFYNFL